jgi:hypothetical protein
MTMDNFEQSVQVRASHYDFANYVSLSRWTSYWHQIVETIAFNPKTVLIVGSGDNVVGKLLVTQGIKSLYF